MKIRTIRWITVTAGLFYIGTAADISQATEPVDAEQLNLSQLDTSQLDAEQLETTQPDTAPAQLEPALAPITSTASPVDPLEQLSTAEWLDLLSDKPDEVDSPPQQISESAADLILPESALPQIRIMPQAGSRPISSPDPQIPAPNRSALILLNKEGTDPSLLKVPLSKGDLGGSNQTEQLIQRSVSNAEFEPEGQSLLVAQNSVAIQTWATQVPVASDSPPWLKNSMAQVTSVSQLADVQPTDWAYQALQSLTERYGAIQGYPDGLFRGERSLTRFEFAAGLNAALDRITQLIASSKDAVTQADLEAVNRLQEDFRDELITLRAKVDGLDARLAEVAANQFSTTVVLNGQTTFGLVNAWGGNPPGLGEGNTVFAYLTQLQLSGSFSERDAFRIDLEAGNFDGGGFAKPEALNTQMALLGFQTDTNNGLELGGVEYRVAIGDRLVATFKPVGFGLDTVLSPNSPYTSASQGAVSRFAAENPVFRIGDLDSGLGLDWLITDRARLQVAYGARDASDPSQGLFNSEHRALGVQLLTRPFGAFTTGIAYVNAFARDGFLDTFTGSTNADTSGGFQESAAIHAVSGTFQWPITPQIVLGAWGGLAITDSLPSDAVAVSSTYQFSLGFPDTFGREGDLLGIMVGQPFRLRYGLQVEREDEASGIHYEIFYRIRVNDNIAITPGLFIVTDPGHVANNDTIIVGAIRSSFEF